MTASELLRTAAVLYERLDPSEFQEDGSVRGTLAFSAIDTQFLQALDDADVVRVVRDRRTLARADFASITPGEILEITIEPPAGRGGYFAQNLSVLLDIAEYRSQSPETFYLADLRFRFPESSPEGDVEQYLRATEFVKLLRGLADHVDESALTPELVLLTGSTKIEIPILYSQKDFGALATVSELSVLVNEPPQAKVKRALFKAAIAETLQGTSHDDQLGALLRQFRALSRRFEHNLELFAREFSFEDEREKFEVQRREYLLKLNGAISDIHTKLIAVPAAVVLVAGQMKAVDSAATLLANVVLWIGAAVFAGLMFLLARNQRHSLDAIRVEYQARRRRVKVDFPNLWRDLKKGFAQLDDRYRHQVCLLHWINGIVVAGLLFSTLVLVFYWRARPAAAPATSIFHLLRG